MWPSCLLFCVLTYIALGTTTEEILWWRNKPKKSNKRFEVTRGVKHASWILVLGLSFKYLQTLMEFIICKQTSQTTWVKTAILAHFCRTRRRNRRCDSYPRCLNRTFDTNMSTNVSLSCLFLLQLLAVVVNVSLVFLRDVLSCLWRTLLSSLSGCHVIQLHQW